MGASPHAVRTETRVVAGVETFVRRAGSGRPVLLLHGLGASSYSWRHAFAHLADGYEVFAPDFPGHGRSAAVEGFDYSIAGLSRWTLDFMDSCGAERVPFVGNSLGGVVSLWTAMEAPRRVERMALVGVPAYPEHRPAAMWPLGWPVFGRLYENLLGPTLLRAIAKTVFVDPATVTDELVDEYSLALRTPGGRRAVAEVIRRAIPPDAAARMARYRELTQPALVLVGEHDRMVKESGARRLAGDLGAARLELVAGVGHAPHEDDPALVMPLVRRFLDGG
ncbi:MAG: alpha/beta hydrolase [Elusimicrobiota bacterium]|nr:alpha/beta hydrolase [Elusimicrobiota bacterium]